MDLIQSDSSKVLTSALDGALLRHKAIASNISNAETPGYQPLKVEFEDQLMEAIQAQQHRGGAGGFLPSGVLKTTQLSHYTPKKADPEIEEVHPTMERAEFFFRMDKNGVDVEHEMASLAKNTQQYQAMSRLQSKMFNALRGVIKGAGGQ